MLSSLRQRYWIPSASVVIWKILSKCVVCHKLHAPPGQKQMADMPQGRIIPDNHPFSQVDVNCFWPFKVKRGRSTIKKLSHFTCLSLRAIHIEVLVSLDTESFMNAHRRFIARRGQVVEMRSDSDTNFVGAEHVWREAIRKRNQIQISNALLNQGIKFTFNPLQDPIMVEYGRG